MTQSSSSLTPLKLIAGMEAATQIVLAGLMALGILANQRGATDGTMLPVAIGCFGVVCLGAAPLFGAIVARLTARAQVEEHSTQSSTQVAGGVIKVAMFGTAGIFGFVSYMLGGSLVWGLGLTGAAVIAIACSWPRSDGF